MRRLLFPHLALWVLGAALVRIALVPAEVCPPVGAAEVTDAAAAASAWIDRGLGTDGRYTYGYLKDVDAVPADYNAVRHAGAVFTLYQMVAAGFDEFLAAADAGFEFMVANRTERDGWAAFGLPGDRLSLGANGLFLVSLVDRRLATGDTTYDDLARAVARFIAGQQEPNGGLLAWWDPRTGAPTPGEHGIFATGEAFWGLARLNGIFPAEGWDDPAERVAHYLANDRDRLEGEVAMYPDHWAAYGMADLATTQPLDTDLIDYARRLAGFFSVRIRVESQRRGEGVSLLVRGYPGPPSGVGTAGEGMAALWRLSAIDDRLADMRPGMEDDLRCMAGIMVSTQFDATSAAAFPRPGLVEGAWFYKDYSQIDDQQHTIAALLAILPVLDAGDEAGT